MVEHLLWKSHGGTVAVMVEQSWGNTGSGTVLVKQSW